MGNCYFRWPWNQQMAFNWIIDNIISTLAAAIYLTINGTFLSFFITICAYHRAFYEYFRSMIEECNNSHDNETMKRLLHGSIRFHISIKQ